VFVTFGVTTALCVPHYSCSPYSECLLVAPSTLLVPVNTRCDCYSLSVKPLQLSTISKSQCAFASLSRNCRLCTEAMKRAQQSFRTVSVPHPSRYTSGSMRNSTTVIYIYIYIYYICKYIVPVLKYCGNMQLKQRRQIIWESPDLISNCSKLSIHLHYHTHPPIFIILFPILLSSFASYSPPICIILLPTPPSVLSSYPHSLYYPPTHPAIRIIFLSVLAVLSPYPPCHPYYPPIKRSVAQ